jgi:hypothetical protein
VGEATIGVGEATIGGPTEGNGSGMHSSATTTLVADGRIGLFRTARAMAAEAPAAPGWVVDGYVAQGAITELDGKLKSSGKTTWLMAMMAKTVEGEPFLGRPTRQTGFVVLSEQNATSFVAALRRARLDQRDDVVILLWSDARGLPWPVLVKMAAEEARSRGYRVVIVDTLPQFAGIRSDGENSSGAALETMEPIQEEAATGLAFIVSRHERKGGGEVGESGRGSSAFSGAVDIVLSLRRPEGQHRDGVRVLQALSRFDETPPELMIELEDGEYTALGTSDEVRARAARQAVLDELPPTPDDALDAKAILEAVQDARIKRTTLYAILGELTESGEVSVLGAGKKKDPYRYWRSQEMDSSAATGAADESNGLGHFGAEL